MVGQRFRATLVVASLTLATLASAGAAHAGTYHVYSCRMPNGGVAPADGWSGSVPALGAFDDYALDTCAGGGALIAALGDTTVHASNVDRSTWTFTAPATARLTAATLWRADDNAGGIGVNSTYEAWLAVTEVDAGIDECIYNQGCAGEGEIENPLSQANRVAVPPARLGSTIYASAACAGGTERACPAGKGDPNGFAAAVYLFAADLTLEQPEGPQASNVGGELASASTLRGQSSVTFDASDPGSGVYEALFSVDGQVVQRTPLDDNGGRCRDVGQTTDGRPAFLYVQPCVGSVSADAAFDSTKVGNGAHHLVVSVIDAAGNAAPVLDRTVTIDNPPAPGTPGPPNGANASAQASMSVRWNATRRPRLVTGFGRARSLSGRLTAPGGAPIAGASVEVRATPAYAGARSTAMRSVLTDASGRFSVRAPAISSRTLRFSYRAHVGDATPAVTRTLRLGVRAGVALRVAPHTTHVGGTIRFRGRLRGGPIPAGGKQLVLEARSPGSSWIEFDVVRTDAHGRYRASYRFKFAGPAHYTFRARSEAESDYPFAAGVSNVVAVYER